MDPIRVAELVIKYAHDRGVDEAEAYVTWGDSCDVMLSKRGIESIVSGFSISVGVRLVKDKRIAIAGGNIASEEDIKSLVGKALENLRACPRDEKWVSLAREVGYTPVTDVEDSRIKSSPIEVAVDIASQLLELPKSFYERASTIEASISCGYGGKVIANSYMSKPLAFTRTGMEMFFAVKAETDKGEGTIVDSFASPTLKDLDLPKMVSRAVEWAKLCSGAKPIETGSYNVVLAPKVFSSIISILICPAVSALNVQRGRSPLRGKIGQRVLNEKITIVDDGAAPGLEATASFDDEGVATQRKVVFDRGMLSTYLYDSYTAYIEGKKPTGNAIRGGASSPPSPGATNFLVLPGSGNLEDFVKDLKRGVVVLNVIGEWLSNFVNGFLSCTVSSGLLIDQGSVKPVTGIVISGNIYELLSEKLIALGNDVENVSGVYAPSALLESVSIAGK